jgi:hypothetical protein
MRFCFTHCRKAAGAALLMGLLAGPAWAQEAPAVPAVKSPVLTSLFFSATELEAISLARKQYMDRDVRATESEADLLDQLQGIKEANQKPKEELQEKFYPQFYLETLIYHAPTDWTVWLKEGDISKKYTPDVVIPPEAPLKIITINKEDISFIWKPKGWVAASGAYKEGTPGINIDKEKQQVVFTLRVNQIMLGKDMQIKEGYTPPVATEPAAVDVKDVPPANAKPQAPAKVLKGAAPKVDPKTPPPALGLYKAPEPANKKKP